MMREYIQKIQYVGEPQQLEVGMTVHVVDEGMAQIESMWIHESYGLQVEVCQTPIKAGVEGVPVYFTVDADQIEF